MKGHAVIARPACGKPARQLGPPIVVDQKESNLKRLTELSGALDLVAIESNAEIVEAMSSLWRMWETLAPPHQVDAARAKKAAMGNFRRMVEVCLRAIRGRAQKGYSVYCPVLRCSGSTGDIYSAMSEEAALTSPEMETAWRPIPKVWR